MKESVRIETIQRIQNKHLWQKYTFFRRVIQRRMDGRDINEKELFHGTRSNRPSMIYESEKGFDFVLALVGPGKLFHHESPLL